MQLKLYYEDRTGKTDFTNLVLWPIQVTRQITFDT